MSSDISMHSDITTLCLGYVWRDEKGIVNATVRLGQATLYFDSPDDARAVAAACNQAAEAIEQYLSRMASPS